MNATSPDLTDPQRIAVAHLAAGSRKRDAAEAAGVHPSTLSHWLREHDFTAALDDARAEVQTDARNRLASAVLAAVDTLVEVMQDRGTPPGTRIRAACAILDRGGLPRASRFEHEADAATRDVYRVVGSLAHDLHVAQRYLDTPGALVDALAALPDDTLDAIIGDLDDG